MPFIAQTPTSEPDETPAPTPETTTTPEPTKEPISAEDYLLSAAPDDETDGMINLRFDNNTGEMIEPCIAVAAYKIVDGTEVLVGFDDENITVDENSYNEFILTAPATDYDFIKVFAWRDYDGLFPLTPSVQLSGQNK